MSESEELEQYTPEQEAAIAQTFGEKFLALSKDEQASLSKVLFPDTHTETVEVLGVKRKLRPLPLKNTRVLNEILLPIAKKINSGNLQKQVTDVTEDVLSVLTETAQSLAQYYKWEDVLAALKEEELSLTELQAIAVMQQRLNGANDFLLAPLRVVVRQMQIQEVTVVKFNSMFSSRVSPESGIAL